MLAAPVHSASGTSAANCRASRQPRWPPFSARHGHQKYADCRQSSASSSQQQRAAGHRRHRRQPVAVARAAQSPATGSSGSSSQAGPKRVVITGGSRGLGFAMAQEFLKHGDSVVLCGRNRERLAAAVEALRLECGDAGRVHGCRADCSSPEDMQRLGEFVQERLGGVDLWLNNSGEVTAKRLLADVDPHEIVRVVGTNVVGSLLGCRTAVALMREQQPTTGPQGAAAAVEPAYHIFNFGFSPWGAKFTKSAVTHKSTKRALAQLNESLAQELKEAGINSIGVHNLSPGMLLTDLLLRDSTPAARRFFNALAEEPETVAAALVPRVRAVHGSGSSIDYLSPPGALLRVLQGLPQIIHGGRFFDKKGQRVAQPGEAYQENGVRVQVQVQAAAQAQAPTQARQAGRR